MTPEQKKNHAEYQKLWRAKNPTSVKKSQLKYRQQNRERRIEQKRAWHEANKDNEQYILGNRARANQWRKDNPIKYYLAKTGYYEKNKEKIAQYKHKWYEENTVNVRLRVRARDSQLQGIKINKEDISNWESRVCGICQELIEGPFDIDHKIPLSRGGKHEVLNLQLAHPTCNNRKYTKTPEEFAKFIGALT